MSRESSVQSVGLHRTGPVPAPFVVRIAPLATGQITFAEQTRASSTVLTARSTDRWDPGFCPTPPPAVASRNIRLARNLIATLCGRLCLRVRCARPSQ